MRYEYEHVSMDDIIKNPEEFIIPECLAACKIFWRKGIETFMCSNHNNATFYISIEFSSLDEANRKILFRNADSPFFGKDIINNRPLIRSRSPEKLVELAELFVFQDSMSYKTNEEILEEYRREGSNELELLPNGALRHKLDPRRADATIEEALKGRNLELYDAEEGKLFKSKFAFEHHKKFREVNAKLQQ